MKRVPSLLIVFASVAVIVVLLWPWSPPPRGNADRPLTCYVGGTMTPVFEALAEAYRETGGPAVEISSADSGELLATIELRLEGDLYVAHDPFMDIAMARGVGVNAWSLAEIFPVLIVAKGNPKNIQSLQDFMRPDVRVYLTDYEHSTLGHMLPIIFNHAGIDFNELNRVKQIPTHRSGSWVANQLILKAADAALVWQAVAHLRRKDLDVIRIDKVLPVPDVDTVTSATGKKYFVAPVNVDIVSLSCSRRQDEAARFVDFVCSDAGKAIFENYGFKVPSTYGRRMYVNGIRVTQ